MVDYGLICNRDSVFSVEMVKIYYFSWVRQLIGKSEEQYMLDAHIKNIADLIADLQQRGDSYIRAFQHIDSVKIAINQEFAYINDTIKDGDEIAFFPPITGG